MLFIPRHALHRAESTTGPGPGPPTCPFEFEIIWDTFLRRRVPDLHPTPMHNRPCSPPPLWRPCRSKKEHRPNSTSEFSGYFRARRPSNDLRIPTEGAGSLLPRNGGQHRLGNRDSPRTQGEQGEKLFLHPRRRRYSATVFGLSRLCRRSVIYGREKGGGGGERTFV